MKKTLLFPLLLILITGCTVNVNEQIDKAKKLGNNIKDAKIEISGDNTQHVVLVPGYGAPVAGNSSYEGYIQAVADFVENKDNEVDTIIFTGSYSALKNTSEAESMYDYFSDISDTDITTYKEECAIISWQNISNTKDLLDEKNITTSRVTVFGDQARKEKLVAYATLKFNENQDVSKQNVKNFNFSLSYTNIDFEGYDFGTDDTEQKALIAAEMAGAYDDKTGNLILQKRIDNWTETYDYDVADNLVSKGCTEFKGFQ